MWFCKLNSKRYLKPKSIRVTTVLTEALKSSTLCTVTGAVPLIGFPQIALIFADFFLFYSFCSRCTEFEDGIDELVWLIAI